MLLVTFAVAQQENPPVEPMDQTPVFRVNVVSRTTKAVNYRHRGGSTTVDIKGTSLMPEVTGKAKVDSKAGRLQINVELSKLGPASRVGPQFLTYVLWAITPEGRAQNLGEIVPDANGKSSLDVTTDLQAFGLIVTAEPYFSVTRPSNEVVAENIIRQETKGFEEAIDAKFDMLEGGQYTIDMPAQQLPSATADPKTPLTLLEARNAVAIAKAAGAAHYAPDSFAEGGRLSGPRRRLSQAQAGQDSNRHGRAWRHPDGRRCPRADSPPQGAGTNRERKTGHAGQATKG